MGLKYRITGYIDEETIKAANSLSIIIESGLGYTCVDRLLKVLSPSYVPPKNNRDDCEWCIGGITNNNNNGNTIPTIQSREKELFRQCGLPHAALWVTVCVKKHYHHGSYVMCPTCLKNGERNRLIRGCKTPTCLANNTFWEENGDSLSLSDLQNAICNHERISSRSTTIA